MITLDFLIRRNARCCISEKPITDINDLTWIQVDMPAKWDFPVWGNFIYGQSKQALAIVHNESIVNGKLSGDIKFVIEFKGEEIVYHPVVN